MAVDNNLILAGLALGAIYLVVQSGEKKTDDAKVAQIEAQGGGVSREQAIDDNPTPQMVHARKQCVDDLQKGIREYQYIERWTR